MLRCAQPLAAICVYMKWGGLHVECMIVRYVSKSTSGGVFQESRREGEVSCWGVQVVRVLEKLAHGTKFNRTSNLWGAPDSASLNWEGTNVLFTTSWKGVRITCLNNVGVDLGKYGSKPEIARDTWDDFFFHLNNFSIAHSWRAERLFMACAHSLANPTLWLTDFLCSTLIWFLRQISLSQKYTTPLYLFNWSWHYQNSLI